MKNFISTVEGETSENLVNLEKVIEKEGSRMVIIALDVEQMTGKEAIELVRAAEKTV